MTPSADNPEGKKYELLTSENPVQFFDSGPSDPIELVKANAGFPKKKDRVLVHGGLTTPINRQVPVQETEDFRRQAADLKRIPLSDADLSTLYRFGDGGLSPLTGPMDSIEFNRISTRKSCCTTAKPTPGPFPFRFRSIKCWPRRLRPGKRWPWSTARRKSLAPWPSTTSFPGISRPISRASTAPSGPTIQAAT